MKLSKQMVEKVHVALGQASVCWEHFERSGVFLADRCMEIGTKLCEELAKEVSNDACGDALQKLWDEIIVARHPNYGDWEYPGQAYRHIKAEFDDLAAAHLIASHKALRTQQTAESGGQEVGELRTPEQTDARQSAGTPVKSPLPTPPADF